MQLPQLPSIHIVSELDIDYLPISLEIDTTVVNFNVYFFVFIGLNSVYTYVVPCS